VPEWLKGADCKSAGYAYVGSNPTPSTSLRQASYNGITLAFQASDAGSIPAACSNDYRDMLVGSDCLRTNCRLIQQYDFRFKRCVVVCRRDGRLKFGLVGHVPQKYTSTSRCSELYRLWGYSRALAKQ
jgi:hypothetical protein